MTEFDMIFFSLFCAYSAAGLLVSGSQVADPQIMAHKWGWVAAAVAGLFWPSYLLVDFIHKSRSKK